MTAEEILSEAESEYFEGEVYGETAYKWNEVIKVMIIYAKQEAEKAFDAARMIETKGHFDQYKYPTKFDYINQRFTNQ